MGAFIFGFVLLGFSLVTFAETEFQTEHRGRNPLDQGADNCPATVIASLPYIDSGTTAGRANNFNFCSGLFSPDVVYQYTAPVNAEYTIGLTSTYGAIVALNTGPACPGNTQVYCQLVPNGIPTQFVVQLIGTLTYYIIVDGQDGALGNYTLSVTQNASCDTCEADSCPATIIPSLPYMDNGTTVGRANNYSANECGGQNAPDVIYSLTVPTTQNIVAKLTNEEGPHFRELFLRSGPTCPGTNVECNLGSNGYGASLAFQALAGVTYYLVVDDQSTRSSAYTLNVFPVCEVIAQPGDLLDCAPEIPGTPHQSNDCNGGCYNEIWGGTPTFQAYTIGQTIFGRMFTFDGTQPFSDRDWFRFNLAQTCSLAATVTAEFPWQIHLKPALCQPTYYYYYTGPACSTTTDVDRGSPFYILPAGNYEMWIESQQDTAMPDPLHYRMRLDAFPVCGEDGAITTLPGSYSSNTCGEGDDCTLDIQQQVDTEDRLVRVDIPEHGSYTFSLCSSAEPWTSFMTVMSSCCDNPFIIAQSNGGCVNGLAQLECIELDSGHVFVLVENDGNEGGPFCTDNFTLSVEPCQCPPIDSLTIEPFEDFSVFLNFTVPTPGTVTIHYSTNPASEFPAGFIPLEQFQANVAGRYENYEIAAPDQSGRFVVTLNGCQQ